MRKKNFQKSMSEKIFDGWLVITMVLFSISILFPLWDMIVTSVSKSNESSTLTYNAWPKTFSLDSYIYCLKNKDVYRAFAVTIYRTVCGTLLQLFALTLAAYPISKKDLPARFFIVLFFIFPMFFTGGLIPTYLTIRYLNLTNNLLVYILPTAFSAFSLLIYRNYLMSMDEALEESAHIDGANIFQVLWLIILPLSKPVLATLTLWGMVGHWNAWFDSLIYMSDKSKVVLQLYLRRLMDNTTLLNSEMQMFMSVQEGGSDLTPQSVRSAITVIVILPITCVYPFLQKYFVKGIMLGSVK